MLGGGRELCQKLVNFPTFSETSQLKGNRDMIPLLNSSYWIVSEIIIS